MKKIIAYSIFFSALFSFVFSSVLQPDTSPVVVDSGVLDRASFEALATDQESVIVSAVARANEAVVSVVATKDVPILERYFEEFNPFGGFFGGFSVPRYRENGTEEREVGGGSGFLVSSDGYIISNRHVVDDEEAQYSVLLNSGESYDVEVVAKDPVLDIAVLKIESVTELPYLTFADSDAILLGQTAIAIGNALAEFRNSVSVGIVSGLSRNIVAGDAFGNSEMLDSVIQTDAAINPGNSGGPLLNSSGEVIGVNVAVAQGSQNIGFAIPSNSVARVFESVQEFGEIVRPFLGVRYIPVTASLAEKNQLPVDYGILIQRGRTSEDLAVMPGSPADKVGLRENDIITKIDGQEITAERNFAALIRNFNPGQTVSLEVYSQGESKEIMVTLERYQD